MVLPPTSHISHHHKVTDITVTKISAVSDNLKLCFFYSNKNLSQCKSQSDDQLDRIGTCDKNEYWPSDTHRKDFKMTLELRSLIVETYQFEINHLLMSI